MSPLVDLAVAVVAVGALLAVGSGLAKLISPTSAVESVRTVGLPSSPLAVRLGAVIELCVGAAVLSSASWLARMLLVAIYTALTAFSLRAVHAGSTAPCGCFGGTGAAISGRHVVVNLVVAAAGLVVLVAGPGSPVAAMHAQAPADAAFLAVAAMTAVLVATSLTRAASA